MTSFGAIFTATGACGREGRVAKHPWAYAPGPKPLNARTRKPYLVLGQRPRTQNCVGFCVRGARRAGREAFDLPRKGPYDVQRVGSYVAEETHRVRTDFYV